MVELKHSKEQTITSNLKSEKVAKFKNSVSHLLYYPLEMLRQFMGENNG